MDDASSLTEYLYETPYGEEDETLLKSGFVQERIQDLSWHARWRVWLRTGPGCDNRVLPHIFAQLQACLLLMMRKDSSFAMWDDDDDDEEEEIEWKRDEMLCNWNTARYFVNQRVQELALNRQDQLDVQRIMQGIDQLVGVDVTMDNHKKSPREVLQDYNDNKVTEKNEDCTAQPAMQFRSWVSSQCSRHRHDNDVNRLLEVVERVPQWRVRRSVQSMPKDLLKEACGRRGVDFGRARALLASFLINANMFHQPMAPVPSLSSASNVSSSVQNYLLHSKGMPNVYGLVLALWDFHLNERDILETIEAFASWFPVEPIVVQYRTILTSMDGSVRQVLRATDMVCTLIGSEAEEWNEIWNDALCRDTLLTLVHAAVLDPDEAFGKCALVGAVLERLFHQHMASVVVTSCPQIGWIAFLLSDLPTQDDTTQKKIINYLGQLYARLSTAVITEVSAVDSVILPPVSIYVDSVLDAALSHSGPAHVWERHVVRTLSLYKERDKVAVEWVQCLSTRWKDEETATNSLVESLYQRVCLSLWGPNVQLVPSIALSQLLMSQHCAGGILLWTPPECLFAHQGNLVVSLRQMCLTYGTSNHLSHIVVGIALLQPNNSAACQHELYQHLRNVVVNGDSTFVKRVERELLPYATSLEWWKELHADLVRNEVPAFVVKSESSEWDADFVDNILSKRRKRQREEHDGSQKALEESLTTRPPKARSRESVTAVLGKIWGSSKRASPVETPLTEDSPIKDVELLRGLENDDGANSRWDDDDDYCDDEEEEDDRILLL